MNQVKIKGLVLLISEKCNYNCTYCYQTQSNKKMDWPTVQQAVSFLIQQPEISEEFYLFFNGGETLFNFSLIKKIVKYIEKKKETWQKEVKYNITTNGSLITDEILEFFNQHHFQVELSFDGLAQNQSRCKHSFQAISETIKKILSFPNIKLVVNSVYTAQTINLMVPSSQYIMDLGVKTLNASLSFAKRWNQASINKAALAWEQLRHMAVNGYKKNGCTAIANFSAKKPASGTWQCSAGQSQLTITADGQIWGCPLFYEYFKDKKQPGLRRAYFFGHVDRFISHFPQQYKRVSSHYAKLRMDHFQTPELPCFLCQYLDECSVCPVPLGTGKSDIGRIPTYVCQLTQVQIRQKRHFLNDISH